MILMSSFVFVGREGERKGVADVVVVVGLEMFGQWKEDTRTVVFS